MLFNSFFLFKNLIWLLNFIIIFFLLNTVYIYHYYYYYYMSVLFIISYLIYLIYFLSQRHFDNIVFVYMSILYDILWLICLFKNCFQLLLLPSLGLMHLLYILYYWLDIFIIKWSVVFISTNTIIAATIGAFVSVIIFFNIFFMFIYYFISIIHTTITKLIVFFITDFL